jgi:serine/threonine protein kinase/WD40 repeat protein
MSEARGHTQLLAPIRREQRERWQAGERVFVESYLERHPSLLSCPDAVLELIYSEIVLREQHDEAPQLEEYVQRFPYLAVQLKPLFEVHRALESASVIEDMADKTEMHGTVPGPHAPPADGDIPVIPGYDVMRELGRGGMGVVYCAWQASLGRAVALKMILAGAYAGPQDRARFRTEAEAIARLQHPNIVHIYDIGEHEGKPYIAMEYVDGSSLARRLAGTPLPARTAAELIEILARAIDHAHGRGIIHRDLTPANVLLQRDEVTRVKAESSQLMGSTSSLLAPPSSLLPKITDFGLAKNLAEERTLRTQTGAFVGTPSYTSPEQATGERNIGPAADIYALGAILYEALTGRPPFKAETPMETLLQVREAEPVPPLRLQPKLPRDVETICLKCLRKEPVQRYPSAAALADDLHRFLRGEPIHARRTSLPGRAWRWCRRNPAIALLAGSVAALLVIMTLAASGVAWWLNDQLGRTLAAEQLAQRRLYDAQLAQARAGRWSGQAGRRFASLQALAEAARLLPAVSPDSETREASTHALRTEALACLTLPDLRIDKQWPGYQDRDQTGIAFDPDVTHYARAEADGSVGVHRLVDNVMVVQIPDIGGAKRRHLDNDWLVFFRFSPDGKLLATRGEPRLGVPLQVWDLAGRRCLLKVPSIGEWYYWDFDFTPDSRTLAVGQADGSVGIYDLGTASRRRSLLPGPSPHYLRFDPTGQRLAICRDADVQVVDVGTGRVRHHYLQMDRADAVDWSADGALLAIACADGQAYIREVEGRQRVVACRGHQGEVLQVAFNHQGNLLATTSYDGTTRLWDPMTGRQLLQAPGYAVSFSRNDNWLGLGYVGSRVGRWEVASGREYQHLRPAERSPANQADISADGRLLTVSGGTGIQIWDLPAGKLTQRLPPELGRWAGFDPLGRWMVTGGPAGLYRWPMTTNASLNAVHLGPAQALRVPRGSVLDRGAVEAGGQNLLIRSSPSRALLVPLDRPATQPRVLAHPDLWHLALSPDGRWAGTCGWNDVHARVWDMTRNRMVLDVAAKRAQLAFSPDGRWVAVGTPQDYAFYEAGSWQECARLPREQAGAVSGPVCFSRDGKLVALTITRHSIRLLETHTRAELATLEGPEREDLNWLRFNSDSTQLVSGTASGAIQVWDLRRLRTQLAEIGLDWGEPLPASPAAALGRPLAVHLDLGEMAAAQRYTLILAFFP